MSQMSDGGGGDIAAPTVFERHRDSHRDAQVTNLLRLCQAAEFADLQIDDIHREFALRSQQHVDPIDVLIKYKRVICLTPNGKTLRT